MYNHYSLSSIGSASMGNRKATQAKGKATVRFAMNSIATMVMLAFLPATLWAQIATYDVTVRTNTTWTDVPTSANAVADPASGFFDDEAYAPITLPFPFIFNQTSYTSVVPSTNGALFFGTAGFGSTNPANSTAPAAIALGADLFAVTNGVYWEVRGTAPNRRFVIQHRDVGFFNETRGTRFFDYQIHLREDSNIVEIYYNNPAFGGMALTYVPFVGLKSAGTTAGEYVSLAGSTTTQADQWANPTVRSDQNPRMALSATINPAAGLMYKFAPVPPPTNNVGIVGISNRPPAFVTFCDSTVFDNFGVIVRNTGTAPQGNIGVNVVLTNGAGTTVAQYTVNNTRTLNTGDADTIPLQAFQIFGLERYRISLTLALPDDRNQDNSFRDSIETTLNCPNMGYTLSNTAGTWTPLANGTQLFGSGVDGGGAAGTINLPFSFPYNNGVIRQVNVSPDGHIAVGANAPGSPSFPLVNSQNIIAVWASDQATAANTGRISYEVSGTAPNRIVTIEWLNMQFWNISTLTYNYQARLHENGTIEFIYGAMGAGAGDANGISIGLNTRDANTHMALRGSPAFNDFNNLTRNYNLQPITVFSAATPVTSGRTYTFTPPPPPADNISMSGLVNLPTGFTNCVNGSYPIGVVVANGGTNLINNFSVALNILDAFGAGTVISTVNQTVTNANLAPGQQDTIILVYQNAGQGFFDFSASVTMTGDAIASDNSIDANVFVGINATCTRPNYTVEVRPGAFNAISGGTPVLSQTSADSDFSPTRTVALPFAFPYGDETTFNSVYISTDGHLRLGGTSFSSSQPVSNNSNVISPFGLNLIARSTSTINWVVEGTAPNREFVVEWSDMANSDFGFGDTTGTSFTFQARLAENGIIRFVYGNMASTALRAPQVGLNQTATSNFIILSLNSGRTTWDSLVETRSTPSAIANFGAGFTIPSGLEITFTPPPPPSNDLAVVSYLNFPTGNQCDSSDYTNIRVIVRNLGLQDAVNPDFRVRISSGSTVLDNQLISSTRTLQTNGSDTLTIPVFGLDGLGTYNLTVFPSQSDTRADNDTLTGAINVTRTCRLSRYSFAVSSSTYAPYTDAEGGTLLGATTSGTRDDGFWNISLPFAFDFNGTPYNNVFLGTNGYISFGAGSTAYFPEGGVLDQLNNAVVAFTRDLNTGAASLYSGTDATTGEFVIQYNGVIYATTIAISWQYRLNPNGTIRVIYGPMALPAAGTSYRPQAGLVIGNGTMSALNIPSVSEDWQNAAVTFNSTAVMPYSSNTVLASGLTYTWTPPVPATNDLAVVGLLNLPTGAFCANGTLANVGVIIANRGANPFVSPALTARLRIGTSAPVFSQVINGTTLAVGERDTLLIPAYTFVNSGNYTLAVSLNNNDDDNTNNSATGNINATLSCSPTNYTFAVSQGSYDTLASGTAISFTSLDDAFTAVPLPTPFTFNGTAYNQVFVSTNGYISFGAGSTVYSEGTVLQNVDRAVVGYGRDLGVAGRTPRYGVDAATGDFVIDYRGQNLNTTERVNIQYRLASDGTIRVVYGAMGPITGTTNRLPQAGLTFTNDTISNVQYLTPGANDWSQVNAVYNLTATLNHGDATVIPAGLTYTWTPPVRTLSANGVLEAIVGMPSAACTGTNSGMVYVRIRNAGNDTLRGALRVTLRIGSIAPQTVEGPLTRFILPGATDTVQLGTLNFTLDGVWSVGARVLATGDIRPNDDSLLVSTTVATAPTTAATITPEGPTTICPGETVTMSIIQTADVYLWSNGATTRSITVTAGGDYTAQYGPTATCLSPASQSITVEVSPAPARPTITPSASTVVCQGAPISIVLTSSALSNNLWSTGDTTRSITVTAIGNYTVRALSASGGCNSQLSDTIRVVAETVARPTISAGGNTSFCAGGQVTLTASVANGYLWSNGATTRSITVSNTGRYTVRAVSALGCQSDSSVGVSVIVNPISATPSITAGGPTSFCPGGQVTLTAESSDAGVSFVWSNGATTPSITVSQGGSYTVRAYLPGQNCTSAVSAATVVTLQPAPVQPVISLSGPTNFCEGGSVTLSGPAGLARYAWSTGDTTQSIVIRTAASNISLRVTAASGCQSIPSDIVTVTPQPRPTTPVVTQVGNNLVATGSASATSYEWFINNQRQSNNTNTLPITVGVAIYKVVALQGICASDTGSLPLASRGFVKSADFKVFPSPATTDITLQLGDAAGGEFVNVSIMDATGKMVMTQRLNTVANKLNSDISIAQLPAGMYQVLVSNEGIAYRATFVKR